MKEVLDELIKFAVKRRGEQDIIVKGIASAVKSYTDSNNESLSVDLLELQSLLQPEKFNFELQEVEGIGVDLED